MSTLFDQSNEILKILNEHCDERFLIKHLLNLLMMMMLMMTSFSSSRFKMIQIKYFMKFQFSHESLVNSHQIVFQFK